jgi:uncharacterized membrane protein
MSTPSATRFELEYRIDRPLAEVYAFLAEPRNRPLWQKSLDAVEVLTPGPPRIGTRWKESPVGLLTFEMEIVELEVERLWVESFRGSRVEGVLRLGFDAPTSASTRIHVAVEVRLGGLARSLGPLVRWLMPGAIRGDLGRVASCLPLATQVRAADLRPL